MVIVDRNGRPIKDGQAQPPRKLITPDVKDFKAGADDGGFKAAVDARVARDSLGDLALPVKTHVEGEFHGVRPADAKERAALSADAARHLQAYMDLGIPHLERLAGDDEIITPDKSNPCASEVLFMISPFGGRFAVARGIGCQGYCSSLLLGERQGGTYVFDKAPLFDDGKSREDPRVSAGKYLTYTLIPDPNDTSKYGVGLALIEDPENPRRMREVGTVMQANGPGVDCKDAVIFPEPVSGRAGMLVRLKPGIQYVSFKSADHIVALAEHPEERDEFWAKMRDDYNRDPRKYNHFHPNMPELIRWEARWKAIIDREIGKLAAVCPESEHYIPHPERDYVWYGSGPAPIKVEDDSHRRYWLTFPHRGQVVAELDEEGKAIKAAKGERIDSLKYYCVLGALHDFDDPTRLVAVSPAPISMPKRWRYEQREENPLLRDLLGAKNAVRYVYITAGAERRVDDGGEPYIWVPIGVDDAYTVPKRLNQGELVNWMLQHGRAGE